MIIEVYSTPLPFDVEIYTGYPNGVSVISPKPLLVSFELTKDGKDGRSAYQIAIENGYVGTEQDWINDLLPQDIDGGIIF
jgi:hypothetical protein